jgi:hypothetical protein
VRTLHAAAPVRGHCTVSGAITDTGTFVDSAYRAFTPPTDVRRSEKERSGSASTASAVTEARPSPRLERAASGQQKGSKRSKSSLRDRAQISANGSQARMNRAIARQSSPIVVSV